NLDYLSEIILAIEESLYSFDQFKSKKSSERSLQEVIFHDASKDLAQMESAIAIAQAQSEGMKLTKDLGNMPGNICTPLYLAEQAQKLAESHDKMSIKILDEEDLEALNMGAFLSVAKGSIEPAKLVVLEYKGANDDQAP